MKLSKTLKKELPLHLMLLPGVILLFLFSYLPLRGLVIAFQDFIPAKGIYGDQEWVGLENFEYLFILPNFKQVLKNTVFIALMKIIFNTLVPIIFALLLNEVRNQRFKKTIQTSVYLPHFLSWVILGGVLIDILSPTSGLVNKIIVAFGGEPIFFLGDNDWFPFTLIVTEVWKEFGYGSVIYLASITNIDPNLYEAAEIDGAGRFRRMVHVTLPGMSGIIVLMMVLNLGNILNAGFDQVFNLYSPPVYKSGDIIDTFVYRIGLIEAQFGVSTAVGLFKSIISLIFISTAYFIASKVSDYRIF